jgi:Phosphodiester glycosidase
VDRPVPAMRRSAHRRQRQRRPARLFLRTVLAIVVTVVVVAGWSVGHALTVAGGGTVSERLAEWARSHYLGPVVTFGEWLTYQAPKAGGKPNVSFKHLGGRTVHKKKHYHGIVPIIPANLGSPAGRPLPGEGVWKVTVSVKGVPAVFKTYVRQSKKYSSYYAAVVSMDQRLLKFSLRPGTEDPGPGHWGVPMDIPQGQRLGLVATFNSGFRINSSGGGFYLHGHYDGRLVRGEASEVYYRNGAVKIGTWGRGGLTMSPAVLGVRQNLKLIVTNGQVPASVDTDVLTNWGATLGGGYNVWRSGVGITSDGRIIYVYGPALDVRTLAELLKRAGCVSAMELDINPDWMSFMYYLAKNHPANPTPVNLLPSQIQPADRYYFISNRDFTAVFSR